jgi:hypothetical protein
MFRSVERAREARGLAEGCMAGRGTGLAARGQAGQLLPARAEHIGWGIAGVPREIKTVTGILYGSMRGLA